MAIKNNDFLKAVGGFGEGFIKTLQSERERKQKEIEFNQEMSYKTRQQNLMNQVYLRDDIRQQQNADMDREKTEFDIRSGYNEMPLMPNAPLFPILQGGQAGGEMNKPFDGVMNPFDPNKFYAPKTEQVKGGETKDARVGADGFIHRWDESKGEYIKTNLKAPEKDIKNPTSPKETTPKESTTPDLSNEIDELEYWSREYSGGDKDAYTNLKSKSDALIAKAKLQGVDDMVWNAYKSGYDYNGTIEAINNYRVKSNQPELTDWQIDVIRRYYNARVPKAYKK